MGQGDFALAQGAKGNSRREEVGAITQRDGTGNSLREHQSLAGSLVEALRYRAIDPQFVREGQAHSISGER